MTDKQIKQTASPGDFIFHSQWMPIFRSFPPEMAGRILHAVIDYLETGILPEDAQLRALCTFLFAHIDADRRRIEDAAPARSRSKSKKEVSAPAPAQNGGKENEGGSKVHNTAVHPSVTTQGCTPEFLDECLRSIPPHAKTAPAYNLRL